MSIVPLVLGQILLAMAGPDWLVSHPRWIGGGARRAKESAEVERTRAADRWEP